MNSIQEMIKSVVRFYADGFRNMSGWGRKAWLIIFIKLFIIFAFLRIFFFHDFLGEKFKDDAHKSEYVRNNILKPGN
jgi:uncharacterized membrane protein